MALISKANACYSMLFDGIGGCYYAEMMGVHMYKAIEFITPQQAGTMTATTIWKSVPAYRP